MQEETKVTDKQISVRSENVHKDVEHVLNGSFPGQPILKDWGPPWLRGSRLDYWIEDSQAAVDVTATPERPITTAFYRMLGMNRCAGR